MRKVLLVVSLGLAIAVGLGVSTPRAGQATTPTVPSGYELVDLITNNDFENPASPLGFEPYNPSEATLVRTTDNPISGTASLKFDPLYGYGRVSHYTDYAYDGGPRAYSVTFQAKLRVDSSSPSGRQLRACTFVYLKDNPVPLTTCQFYPVNASSVVDISLAVQVNGGQLDNVYPHFTMTNSGSIVATLDDAHFYVVQPQSGVTPSTPPAAVSDLALSNPTASSILLTWTAPGNDGTTGTATSYDIRYSTSPITDDAAFNAATQVSGEPAPLAAGTSQSMTVSSLSADTTYYFALKTSDEVPNVSELSNVPSAATSAQTGGGGGRQEQGSVTDLLLSARAIPDTLPAGGGSVTFQYVLQNAGGAHISDVDIRADLGGVPCGNVQFVGGDADNDGLLDPSDRKETWVFACTTAVTESVIHRASASGVWNFGRGTSNQAAVQVLVGTVTASANAHFHAQPFPAVLHPGGGVATLAYHVGNLGGTPISNPRFSGDFCRLTGPLNGDVDRNGLIDLGEVWTYACEGAFTESVDLSIVFTGQAGDAEVTDTADVRIDIGASTPRPSIHLHVEAAPARLPYGGGAAYLTYHVYNDGSEPLRDILVANDSAACASPSYVEGDEDGDHVLEFGERWTYRCLERIQETVAYGAVVRGQGVGRVVLDDALFIVPVAERAASEADPTVEGAYDREAALANTPDIDTNGGYSAHPAASACLPGVLYKLADDGNPATHDDATVWYCGRDGFRHAFPNEGTYRSWYPNFDGLFMLSRAAMQALPVGAPVTYRPGARLVKAPTSPATYAVARGGVLRWMQTEELAAALYGASWSALVDDLPETMLQDYRIGTPIVP